MRNSTQLRGEIIGAVMGASSEERFTSEIRTFQARPQRCTNLWASRHALLMFPPLHSFSPSSTHACRLTKSMLAAATCARAATSHGLGARRRHSSILHIGGRSRPGTRLFCGHHLAVAIWHGMKQTQKRSQLFPVELTLAAAFSQHSTKPHQWTIFSLENMKSWKPGKVDYRKITAHTASRKTV